MQLRYGSWTSDSQECRVAIARSGQLSEDRSYIKSITETWQIEGIIVASTSSAIASAITARKSAFDKGGYDAKLLFPDGTVAHMLDSSKSLDGVMVTSPPSFPGNEGNEYATQLTWTATLMAEFPTREEDNITDFSESVSHTGGYRRLVGLEALNTLPVVQEVAPATPQVIRQAGRITSSGHPEDPYPSHPGPLFPALEDGSQRAVSRETSMRGTKKTVTWSYTFISSVPLLASPNYLL